ncbi:MULTISPECIES: hypothetical protein [unclassified Prochlorococcus]|uniref:hypothetical protein n=1 Tax=unclassified Prochlorococcus TaxID=2627481 RepID=UPI00145F1A1E|nr:MULTISPECIES: hypothetical protein [unclassified Prochlorococcus]NMO84307.1 hypothetical protein [Prochlorococcus sp. P1344]NMP13019.1 hypothetical protein [Prochlorococcus sp.P1363]
MSLEWHGEPERLHDLVWRRVIHLKLAVVLYFHVPLDQKSKRLYGWQNALQGSRYIHHIRPVGVT